MPVETIKWTGDVSGCSEMIDQTVLPGTYSVIQVRDVKTMWDAIRKLKVRGAPAIGIAAGYGVVLGMQAIEETASIEQAREVVGKTCDYLATSRPTAVNLFWALDRMKTLAMTERFATVGEMKNRLLDEAKAIQAEDSAMCRAIGRNGAGLIKDGDAVLTHCNAGGLATADYGTALALMYTAQEQGKQFKVYADETRPLLQGARLTTWELDQAGIDVTLICDNMSGHLMSKGKVDLIVTGADRIAANGDSANKIGTYALAVLAKYHHVPFYIAAPSSTFDMSIPDGSHIPIEERDGDEVAAPFGCRVAPEGMAVYNPAFDVTPHELIKGIITEKGLIENPTTEAVKMHFAE